MGECVALSHSPVVLYQEREWRWHLLQCAETPNQHYTSASQNSTEGKYANENSHTNAATIAKTQIARMAFVLLLERAILGFAQCITCIFNCWSLCSEFFPSSRLIRSNLPAQNANELPLTTVNNPIVNWIMNTHDSMAARKERRNIGNSQLCHITRWFLLKSFNINEAAIALETIFSSIHALRTKLYESPRRMSEIELSI